MSLPRPRDYLGVRLVAYFFIQAVVLWIYGWALVAVASRRFGEMELEDLLRENKILEWVQLGLLFVIALLCAGAFAVGRPLLHRLLGLLAVFALFRELDSFLEDFAFENAHTAAMTLVFVAGAVMAFRGRAELKVELPGFIGRPGFWIMLFGGGLVAIYAQIFGQREIWDRLAPDDVSEAKRLVEEGLELMGYLVIGCGVVEERFFTRRGAEPTS